MPSIASDESTVLFSLMDGAIQELGRRGYQYQVPGLGSGAVSNTRSIQTHDAANQSTVTAWIFTDSRNVVVQQRRLIQLMITKTVTVVDQHGDTWTCILINAESREHSGRTSFAGTTWPYRLELTLKLEVTG
jgi:hypothetical protein